MTFARVALIMVSFCAVGCHSVARASTVPSVGADTTDPHFATQVTDPEIIAALKTAPLSVLVHGQRLVLWAGLWRDFMPPAQVNGGYMGASLRITSSDNAVLVTALRIDTTWVLKDGEVWAMHHAARIPQTDTSRVYEVGMYAGPKWPPELRVDVVVRVQDVGGRSYLLRRTGVRIVPVS